MWDKLFQAYADCLAISSAIRQTSHRDERDGYPEQELMTGGGWGDIGTGQISMSNHASIDIGLEQESSS